MHQRLIRPSIPEDNLKRFHYEEEHPCLGNSKHICIICGKEYSCYACPDTLNPEYSQTTCEPCLDEMINKPWEKEK